MPLSNTAMKYAVTIDGAKRIVDFSQPANETSHLALTIDGRQVSTSAIRIARGVYSILIGGRSFEVAAENISGATLVRANGRDYKIEIFDPRSWQRGRGAGVELEGRQQLVAPMPGKVVRVLVKAGEKVTAGQGLVVIEAMKMQNEIRSPKAGTIEKVARENQTVNAGEVLAIVI